MEKMISLSQTKDHKCIAQLNLHVQNLHAKIHPEIFKPHNLINVENALKTFLKDPCCHCYLASEDYIYVGYALFYIREIKETAFQYSKRTLYIDQICVLPEHQKKGVGQLLMEQAEKLAQETGISKIELDHWSANVNATNYFRKNGYQLCKETLFKIID